jgi:glycerol transport system substrate-binding protein
MTFGEAGPVPAQGQIAVTANLLVHRIYSRDDQTRLCLSSSTADRHSKVAYGTRAGERTLLEARAPQNGYQDVGSWTFFKNHDENRTAAAWLYAQFVTK